jgi:hypothetical protein
VDELDVDLRLWENLPGYCSIPNIDSNKIEVVVFWEPAGSVRAVCFNAGDVGDH